MLHKSMEVCSQRKIQCQKSKIISSFTTKVLQKTSEFAKGLARNHSLLKSQIHLSQVQADTVCQKTSLGSLLLLTRAQTIWLATPIKARREANNKWLEKIRPAAKVVLLLLISTWIKNGHKTKTARLKITNF